MYYRPYNIAPMREWIQREDNKSRTHYMDETERERFEVKVANDKLYYAYAPKQGSLVHTVDMTSFVMGPYGKIYIEWEPSSHVLIHHSSYLAGGPVSAAGQINVAQGTIIEVDNLSGHYCPDQQLNNQLFLELELQGMNKATLNRIQRSGFIPGTPDEMYPIEHRQYMDARIQLRTLDD